MNEKHLVIRLPNWVGDVIMALPSLEALHSAGYTFELIGKPWIKDLFSAYSYRTHIMPSNFWDIRRLYLKTQADRMILLANGWSTVLPLLRTGIKSFGYYRSKLQRLFLHQSIPKNPGFHEVEYFWRLTQFAIKKPLPVPKNPKLQIAEHYQIQAEVLLKQFNIKNGFYVVCPGAIGNGMKNQSKIWPHWQSLCAHLAKQNIPIIICPAPFETKTFSEKFGDYALILTDLNLPLYAAVMQRATYVIANDSGPMHMAAAVQAPVIGVFGQSDPQRTHPWGGKFIGDLNHWPSCDEVLASLGIRSV